MLKIVCRCWVLLSILLAAEPAAALCLARPPTLEGVYAQSLKEMQAPPPEALARHGRPVIRVLEYWGLCPASLFTIERQPDGGARIETAVTLEAGRQRMLWTGTFVAPATAWSTLAESAARVSQLARLPHEAEPGQSGAVYENCYRANADQFLTTIHRVRIEVYQAGGPTIRERNDCQADDDDPAFGLLEALAQYALAAQPACATVFPFAPPLARLQTCAQFFGNARADASLEVQLDQDDRDREFADHVRLHWPGHGDAIGPADAARPLAAAGDACQDQRLRFVGVDATTIRVEGVMQCQTDDGRGTDALEQQTWTLAAGTWRISAWDIAAAVAPPGPPRRHPLPFGCAFPAMTPSS